MDRRRILWPLVIASENDCSYNRPAVVHSASAWRVVFGRIFDEDWERVSPEDPRWDDLLFTNRLDGKGWRALCYVRLARRLVKRYDCT